MKTERVIAKFQSAEDLEEAALFLFRNTDVDFRCYTSGKYFCLRITNDKDGFFI